MREPFHTKLWRDWPALLDATHKQAEAHPGFIDRYRGENDPLGYIAPRYPVDELVMGNLSIWRSLADLQDFTFSGVHGGLMKNRSRWFEPWPYARPSFVAWRAKLSGFSLDTAMLMQAELGRTGPTQDVFGWEGPSS